MWICSRCQTKNREGDTRCIQCSAPRSAGRFGAGTAVEAPSVSGAAEREVRAPQVYAAPQPHETKAGARPAFEHKANAARAEEILLNPPHAKRQRAGAARLLYASGLILAFALPALLILLSVLHYGEFSPQVTQLFFPGPAAEVTQGAAAAAPALHVFIYVILSALAALLVMLPGLTAMALGRLLSSLARTRGRHY